MIVFKILLIILVSAPAAALGVFLFIRVNTFVSKRNEHELNRVRRMVNDGVPDRTGDSNTGERNAGERNRRY
jgi:hypothetical protein